MIILDNYLVLDTVGMDELRQFDSFSAHKTSLTGQLIVTQGQFFRPRRRYTVMVNADQRDWLEQFMEEHFGPFDFIDSYGFSWLTTAGTDDATHAYNTGAYFAPGQSLTETPQQPNSRLCSNAWEIPIEFVINARGRKSSSATPGGLNSTVFNETPGGTIDGSNDTFTLTKAPATLMLFVAPSGEHGAEQKQGVDYTLSGSTITFAPGSIPATGSSLDAFYTL